ncbi:hypothetical protein V1517DRAFT_285452 [Lipomyces orientalis]|uniref:Uncharacterized protein n=1 Tax=Lipomyces orientalis TaxID=1233043 RepID=A0ACC3TWM1_9ASCO
MGITIHDFPDEMIVGVFSWLGSHCFLNVSQVCSRWRGLTRVDHILAKHIRNHLCETHREREYLDVIQHGSTRVSSDSAPKLATCESWVYFLYLYMLRRKLVAMELYPKYRIYCNDMTRTHPHFECSTFSADGSLYIAVYRDRRTLPTPLRIIRVYSLAGNMPRLSHSFVFIADTDRAASDVVVSRDVQSLAIAFNIGYVEVYKLRLAGYKCEFSQQPSNQSPSSASQNDMGSSICEKVYSKQFPSSIHSLAVSSGAEMLVLGCRRLGGLTIINLTSGAELDVPHYRLDLEIGLQARDEALCLRGWNETIVMRSFYEEAWNEKENIWTYFEEVLNNMESTCVQLEEAVSLTRRHFFVGTKIIREPVTHWQIRHDEDDWEAIGAIYENVTNIETGINANAQHAEVEATAESDGIGSAAPWPAASTHANGSIAVDGQADAADGTDDAQNDSSGDDSVAEFDIPMVETHEVRLYYMPDYDEEDIPTDEALLRDADEEGVRAFKVLDECDGAYRVVLNDDTNRLLVAQPGTVRLFSLGDDLLNAISSYCPARTHNENLSVMNRCMNLIIEKDLKDHRAPMMGRQFRINMFDKPVIDMCFMDSSGIVVEYPDEIVVYELSPVPRPCINLRMTLIGEIKAEL